MKRIFLLSAVLGICTSYVPISWAAVVSDNTQRLCMEKDLTGIYAETEVRENPIGEEAAWFKNYPNQYIKFYENHTYGYVASRHKMASPDELEKDIVATSTGDTNIIERKYTLDAAGVLDLYIRDKLDYSFRCMVILNTGTIYQAGDLMLTGYSKNKALLYKLFRRWPPAASKPQGAQKS